MLTFSLSLSPFFQINFLNSDFSNIIIVTGTRRTNMKAFIVQHPPSFLPRSSGTRRRSMRSSTGSAFVCSSTWSRSSSRSRCTSRCCWREESSRSRRPAACSTASRRSSLTGTTSSCCLLLLTPPPVASCCFPLPPLATYFCSLLLLPLPLTSSLCLLL